MSNGRAGTGALPAYPLYVAITRIIRRRDHELNWPFPSAAGHAGSASARTTCIQAGISDRQLRRWRLGENPYVAAATLDTACCGLGLLWWDVYNADTVRIPILVAHTRRRTKRRRGPNSDSRFVIEKGIRHHGDLGTDWVELGRITALLDPADQMEMVA